MSSKKLLFVISTLESSGGAERALTNRANYLAERFNYNICVVTTNLYDSCQSFYPLSEKIQIINIPIDFSKKTLIQKILTIFPTYENEKPLLEFIQNNNYKICTSFGSESLLYKKNRHKNLIRIKEQRFTYKKYISGHHQDFIKSIWRKIRFHNFVSVIKKMDYIIALTREDGEFWRNYVKKVRVFPNFIDTRNLRPSTLNEKVIIAVGRLETEKDYDSLIEAFNKIHSWDTEWKLNIFGSGSLQSTIEDRIQKLNLQKQVFLKGSTTDIFSEYENSAIFVMTSLYEGFPNAMLEAMSHGLPVVAFESVGGVKVLVENEVNGFLVKNRNVKEFSERLLNLMENENLRKEMGRNSRQTTQQFSIDNVMEKWHQFYSTLIHESN